MTVLSDRIKQLRRNSFMTQKELAERWGVSQNAIYNWENGKREPNIETLDKIAKFFNVNVNYLLGQEDNTNSTTSDNADKHYYIDDETREIAQEVFENPELRTLFHVARDIPPERLKAHIEFMKSLKAQEKGDPNEPC